MGCCHTLTKESVFEDGMCLWPLKTINTDRDHVYRLEHSIPQEYQCYYNQTPKRFLSMCMSLCLCICVITYNFKIIQNMYMEEKGLRYF